MRVSETEPQVFVPGANGSILGGHSLFVLTLHLHLSLPLSRLAASPAEDKLPLNSQERMRRQIQHFIFRTL